MPVRWSNGEYMNQPAKAKLIERLPTGIPELDAALLGGLPIGQLATIEGEPGTYKTSLGLALCKAAQDRGCVAAFVDGDASLSFGALARAGLSTKGLVVVGPDHIGQAMHVVEALLTSRSAEIIVIDSLRYLPASPETPPGPARLAEALLAWLPRLAALTAQAHAVVVFTVPLRPGLFTDAPQPGGLPVLEHAASIRLHVERGRFRPQLTVKKNRYAEGGAVVDLHLPNLAGVTP